MKKNVGSIDKVVRYILAASFVILYFTNVVTGVLGIVLLVLAGVFVLTALAGICPIYLMTKLSTAPKKE